MRTTAFLLGFARLLSTAIAQEWQVAAYTGQRCNGEQLSLHEPLQQPADDRECRFFTHHVSTTSVVFSVAEDNTDTWIFGLHASPNDNSCVYDQEGAGSYTLQPGANNVCVQLQEGESTFHVQRSSARKTRRAQDYAVESPSHVERSSAVSIRPPYELVERQNDGWVIIFAGLGGIAAVLGEAVRNCIDGFQGSGSAFAACAGYGIATLLSSVALGRQVRGMFQEAANLNNPVRLLNAETSDYYANVLGLDAGPLVSDKLHDGYTTTITRLPSLASRSDGTVDSYLHLSIQDVNTQTGELHDMTIDLDTLSNHTVASTSAHLSQHNDDGLHRRQAIEDYTYYYSWDNWDYEDAIQFPQSVVAHERLANEIWDYMVGEDIGEFCMALGVTTFNGLEQATNNGHFAMISGTFSDQKLSCA